MAESPRYKYVLDTLTLLWYEVFSSSPKGEDVQYNREEFQPIRVGSL